MTAPTIIPGDLDDPRIVALLELHVERARHRTSPRSNHALDVSGLKAPDIDFWAMWAAGEPVAVGALRRLSDDLGEVKSMHTAEAFRGRGAGRAMLAHIVAAARARGLSRLSLETGAWAYFEPARALYRGAGFVECEPFGDYWPDPNSVFMTLDLTG